MNGPGFEGELVFGFGIPNAPAGYLVGPRIEVGGQGLVYVGLDTRFTSIGRNDVLTNGAFDQRKWDEEVAKSEDEAEKEGRIPGTRVRRVAIKFLRSDGDSSTNKIRREFFDHELNALVNLSGHPNLVVVHDIGTHEMGGVGNDYIVFEYLARGSLEKNPPVGDVAKLRACLDAATGLAFMHSIRWVHRDIKPANLLWTPGERVKVADLGLSTGDGERADKSIVVGTRDYAPPERLRAYVDSSSGDALGRRLAGDVYSFAVTCYTILTSQHPYPRGHNEAADAYINRIIAGAAYEAPLACTRHKAVSRELSEMLKTAMSPRWDDRKEVSMGSLQQALGKSLLEAEVGGGVADQGSKIIERMRQTVTQKSKEMLNGLAIDPHSKMTPRFHDGNKNWYGFFMVRGLSDPTEQPFLRVVYAAKYCGSKLVGEIDWTKPGSGYRQPLIVGSCCSGIPIEIHDEGVAQQWREDGFMANDRMTVSANNSTMAFHYIILQGLRQALAGSAHSVPYLKAIHERYAGVLKQGSGTEIKFSPIGSGPMMAMGNTSTEIVVPIYSPLPRGRKSAEHVAGILNFEWEESLSYDRAVEIGDYVYKAIDEGHSAPFSQFLCSIVEMAAPK